MALLQRGDQLPDLSLTEASGTVVSLAMLAGEQTVLIFLRHLA